VNESETRAPTDSSHGAASGPLELASLEDSSRQRLLSSSRFRFRLGVLAVLIVGCLTVLLTFVVDSVFSRLTPSSVTRKIPTSTSCAFATIRATCFTSMAAHRRWPTL
jgi:hypothetical protein